MINRVTRLTRITVELFRYQGSKGLSTLTKALVARAVWGLEIDAFLMQGLEDRPMRYWRDSISYFSELEPGLRAINWGNGGKQLTVDKLMTAERLADHGLPAAPIMGVVGRNFSAYPGGERFPSLATADAILAALKDWPDELFVKPATGWRGEGILGPRRTGTGWDVDGKVLPDRDFAELLLKDAPAAGLLVQQRLRSHLALEPIGGNLGLGTLRIHTALTSQGPRFIVGFAKLLGSECLVDNFSGGKFGNMLARIDAGSGELREVYGRFNGQRHTMTIVERHPVTGVEMRGFRIPLWEEAVGLALSVTEAFPEAPLIAMDIAITHAGPVIIEVQSDWAPNIAQRFMGQGFKPILRELLPLLPIDSRRKAEAAEKLGLNRSRVRRSNEPAALRLS